MINTSEHNDKGQFVAKPKSLQIICSNCNISKTIADFHNCAKGFMGKVTTCKKCRQKEYLLKVGRQEIINTHHLSNSRIYRIWESMRSRCKYPSHNRFHRYGGRGIKVCTRWLEFENFYEDMKANYKPNLQLDRINTDGNYNKRNCRWVTAKEQQNNRSNNRFFTHNNLTLTMKQWAEKLNINHKTLSTRINRDHLSFYEAINRSS